MASMKRPRLLAVQALPKHRLALTFVDGRKFTVDMSDDVRKYPGLARLQDPKQFRRAVLADAGWSVEWPDLDIQIGADTLWMDALAQSAADEYSRTFFRWRAEYRLSLNAAAEALGVAPRTISRYNSGQPVPKSLALACVGWEVQQREHH